MTEFIFLEVTMNKMEKCKTCGTEIAKSAKTCPSCGAKVKKPIYTKWWIWLIAVIIIGSAIGSTGDKSQPAPSNSTAKTEKNEEIMYNIGDIVTTKNCEVTISNVSEKMQVGSQYFNKSPAEGGVYVAVDWSVKNTSEKPISSFSIPSIYIVDKNGTKYNTDVEASTYYATETKLDTKVLSDLNPGINIKEANVFEISKELYDKGGFFVVIDAEKDIKVKLN